MRAPDGVYNCFLAAQLHHQRRYAGHTRLPVIKRAHRAVGMTGTLGHARRPWFGGAAHLQAREKSSTMMISLTDSVSVTGRCDVGSASTCERRAGA